MNAYELAEHLEKTNYMGAITSADMLGQQAQELATLTDRIAELEKEVKENIEHNEILDKDIAELEKENKFFKEDNEAMQKQIADLVVNRLEDRV